MHPEILLVRQEDGYRILHGYLHLANSMREAGEAIADVSGEGKVKVVKTATGILIGNEDQRLPLLTNDF